MINSYYDEDNLHRVDDNVDNFFRGFGAAELVDINYQIFKTSNELKGDVGAPPVFQTLNASNTDYQLTERWALEHQFQLGPDVPLCYTGLDFVRENRMTPAMLAVFEARLGHLPEGCEGAHGVPYSDRIFIQNGLYKSATRFPVSIRANAGLRQLNFSRVPGSGYLPGDSQGYVWNMIPHHAPMHEMPWDPAYETDDTAPSGFIKAVDRLDWSSHERYSKFFADQTSAVLLPLGSDYVDTVTAVMLADGVQELRLATEWPTYPSLIHEMSTSMSNWPYKDYILDHHASSCTLRSMSTDPRSDSAESCEDFLP